MDFPTSINISLVVENNKIRQRYSIIFQRSLRLIHADLKTNVA